MRVLKNACNLRPSNPEKDARVPTSRSGTPFTLVSRVFVHGEPPLSSLKRSMLVSVSQNPKVHVVLKANSDREPHHVQSRSAETRISLPARLIDVFALKLAPPPEAINKVCVL